MGTLVITRGVDATDSLRSPARLFAMVAPRYLPDHPSGEDGAGVEIDHCPLFPGKWRARNQTV